MYIWYVKCKTSSNKDKCPIQRLKEFGLQVIKDSKLTTKQTNFKVQRMTSNNTCMYFDSWQELINKNSYLHRIIALKNRRTHLKLISLFCNEGGVKSQEGMLYTSKGTLKHTSVVWRPFSPLGALFENVITIWTSTFIWLSFAAKRPGRGVRFIQGFILRWVCTRPWSLHIDPQWGSGTVRLVPSNHLLRLFGLFIIQTAHWWSGCRFRSVNRYYDIKISEYICNMCTSGTRNGTTFT